MKLYFLRHGESQANLEKVYARPDAKLTDRGREQAREAGLAIRSLGITRILASDYRRTVDTARIASEAAGLSASIISLEPRLRELGVGDLVGQTSRGVAGYLDHQADSNGDENVEPLSEAEARLSSLIESVARYQEDNILLVGHTGSGTILLGLLTGDHSNPGERVLLPNARIIEFPNPVGVAL